MNRTEGYHITGKELETKRNLLREDKRSVSNFYKLHKNLVSAVLGCFYRIIVDEVKFSFKVFSVCVILYAVNYDTAA